MEKCAESDNMFLGHTQSLACAHKNITGIPTAFHSHSISFLPMMDQGVTLMRRLLVYD